MLTPLEKYFKEYSMYVLMVLGRRGRGTRIRATTISLSPQCGGYDSRVLQKPLRSCACTAEYYRSTREAVLVQQSAIGALGMLCCNRTVLQEHSRGCAGTAEYYMSTRESGLVQQNTIGALGWLCWYSRVLHDTQKVVLVQKSTIGTLGRLCWYSRLI